jgi:hypothetical protein
VDEGELAPLAAVVKGDRPEAVSKGMVVGGRRYEARARAPRAARPRRRGCAAWRRAVPAGLAASRGSQWPGAALSIPPYERQTHITQVHTRTVPTLAASTHTLCRAPPQVHRHHPPLAYGRTMGHTDPEESVGAALCAVERGPAGAPVYGFITYRRAQGGVARLGAARCGLPGWRAAHASARVARNALARVPASSPRPRRRPPPPPDRRSTAAAPPPQDAGH